MRVGRSSASVADRIEGVWGTLLLGSVALFCIPERRFVIAESTDNRPGEYHQVYT